MGFILTVCYVILSIISPDQFGPGANAFHPMLFLAGLIFVVSLPALLSRKHLWSCLQTFLLIGFTVAIALSHLAHGWLGGAMHSWLLFLPAASVYLFIVANVTTARRLRILMAAIVASCLFIAVEAMFGYYAGFGGNTFILLHGVYFHDHFLTQFTQIRGIGFLNDPNDLAQMLILALPLTFVSWQRRRLATNFFLALVPSALLLWAIYLTHSRGALLGLAVLTLMAVRKKLPTIVSLILVSVLVMTMLALDFAGGRGISISDGEDRLEAWSNGLQMFKSAPVFGIGFGGFTERNNYLTAHNSLVLCLAELGLVGSTLWVALLVTTAVGLNNIQRPHAAEEARDDQDHTHLVPNKEPEPPVPPYWTAAVYMALLSFITTSWFLSRSYSITMYLLIGLATATIAIQRSTEEIRDHNRWLLLTLTAEAAGILFIYSAVRLR
jgi:putative inorganic carbon (hco3(-)) transporter